MRTTMAVLIVAATTASARADEAVIGTYDVKFEEMASNCTPPPVALGRGKVTIDIKKDALTVNTDLIPQLVGVPAKNGKINAKTNKVVGTTVVGLSGKYSVAGRVEGGMLQLVLVAEYINQKDGRPYCTQSWNINGARSTDEPAKDKK
jgi:hypothetical protein